LFLSVTPTAVELKELTVVSHPSGLFILGAVLHLLVPPKEKNIRKRGKEKEIFSSTSSYRLVESSV
jgi:hypothetical protein